MAENIDANQEVDKSADFSPSYSKKRKLALKGKQHKKANALQKHDNSINNLIICYILMQASFPQTLKRKDKAKHVRMITGYNGRDGNTSLVQ